MTFSLSSLPLSDISGIFQIFPVWLLEDCLVICRLNSNLLPSALSCGLVGPICWAYIFICTKGSFLHHFCLPIRLSCHQFWDLVANFWTRQMSLCVLSGAPQMLHYGIICKPSLPSVLTHVHLNSTPRESKHVTVNKNWITMAVTSGRFHELAILVVACHCLVTISLTTFLGISLCFHSQQQFRFPLW